MYITNLNVFLKSCSSAIDCTLGCGTLGYLVLTAQPTAFKTHCVKKLVIPKNPGIHPVMPYPAPTAAILSELVRTHKHKVRLFNEYHAVDRACKKIISKLIPQKLYKSLSSRIIGYAKVTSLEIMTHLISKYAKLEEEDIQEIDRNIKEPISGETMFEEFSEKIEWNQEAIAVQNPYSPDQNFSMAYAIIDKCGVYQDDCCDWSRKPRSEKTWVKFKTHFAQAFKETRRYPETSRTDGYVSHVHSAQANAELFTEMQQDHTQVLANIVTATQADRTSVALLKKTISERSSQVALLTAKLVTEQAENARMKKSVQQSTTAGHGHQASSNTTL